jgi:hypothetical protein
MNGNIHKEYVHLLNLLLKQDYLRWSMIYMIAATNLYTSFISNDARAEFHFFVTCFFITYIHSLINSYRYFPFIEYIITLYI